MRKEKIKGFLIIFNLVAVSLVLGILVGYFINNRQIATDSAVYASSAVKDLGDGSLSFRDVAKKTLPIVVQIETVSVQKMRSFSMDLPFEFFFKGRDGKKNESEQEQQREFKTPGLGSGVIFSKKGEKYYVLTNNHVVDSASEINVVTNSEKSYIAKIIGVDARTDVAVLSIETKDNLDVATIGDSDLLEVGDIVFAVGSPMGYSSTFTQGVVSAKGRKGPANILSDFIQTDAAINRGNSGGALVDIEGKVIGINTWIASTTGENAGLGFAIPINIMIKRANSLINNGKVEYGWLGINISDAAEEFLDENGLKGVKGAFVHNIYLDSPAEKSGLRAGDYIVEIDGRNIKDSDSLVQIVADFKAGENKNFKFFRNGKYQNLSVKIGVRASEDKISDNSSALWPGISVSTINDDVINYFKLDKKSRGVVVIRVEKDSKFYIGGLRAGDLIVSINDILIKKVSDFYKVFSDSSGKYSVEYERENNKFFIGVKK